jgi:steroid 5-alpha reductase family enzyme
MTPTLHLALHLILIGTGLVAAMMFVLWAIHLVTRNAGIVDVGWVMGLVLLTGVAVVHAPITAAGIHTWGLTIMVTLWGVRLGLHILIRMESGPEDPRYAQMRREWKTFIPLKFLAFFELQALLDVVLALPFLAIALDPSPRVSPLCYVGVAIWFVAVIGETISDVQLSRFKRIAANKGKVCRVGLWNYSRHPNYFFEWLIWVAWAALALPSPGGYVGLIGPILMFYFLFRVTGIPATEAQALRSRGDAYREYQETTSAFVPWFRKKSQSELRSMPL